MKSKIVRKKEGRKEGRKEKRSMKMTNSCS
jgi:hypothetical protein